MTKKIKMTKIMETYKITAITSLVVGLLAYAYVFLNPIFIHDGSSLLQPYNLSLSVTAQRLTPFSAIWSFLQGGVQLPWFAGVLGLVLCGISAFFVCDFLEVRSKLIIVLISGIMTTAPALISANMYSAGALIFIVALLFASLAAWLCKGYSWKNYVLAIICVTISAGTYTSYISWTASILVIKTIKELINNKTNSEKEILKKELLHGIVIISGIIICIIVSFAILKINVVKPQGRIYDAVKGEVKGFSRFEWIWNSFVNRLIELFPTFLTRNMPKNLGYYSLFEHNTLLALLFWVSWIFMFVIIVRRFKKNRFTFYKAVLLLLNGVILFFVIDVLTYITFAHVLMQYAHIVPWIMLLVLLDIVVHDEKPVLLEKVGKRIIIGMSMFTVVFCCLVANVGYMKDEANYRAGILAANRIAYRLETIENYNPEKKVYFVGDLSDYGRPSVSDFYLPDGITGVTLDSAYTDYYVLEHYLDQQIGIKIQYAAPYRWVKSKAKDYFDYLNDAYNGCFSEYEEEFVKLFSETEDLPSNKNYFWFHDILVFRLQTKQT